MAALHRSLRLLGRFVAPLLLLMISIHALTPLGQPVQRVTGSAFSAETVDVSLRSGKRMLLVKQANVVEPPVTMPKPVEQSVTVPVDAVPAYALRAWRATGPPHAARTSFRPLSARAPPAA